jgi:hypothetical protein
MKMEKTYAYHKPSAGGLEMITKLREAYSALHNELASLRGLCEGIRVIPDPTGTMVSPDEYIVIAGERLYKKLKGES